MIFALVGFFIMSQATVSCTDGISGQVKSDLRTLESALDVYKEIGGQYPSEAQGLMALVEKPKIEPLPKRWIQVYEQLPIDPWKTPYCYRFSGPDNQGKPKIISAGPDLVFDTEDDFSSWRAPH